MDIQEIFEKQLKIESKVLAIEALFNNKRRLERTNYEPSYQRNYVWDDDKATYFIESILLGTEIPPIIFFNSGEKIEVIDGRQRYETIKRFIDKKFKLRKGGLLKLKDLANKNFDNLKELKDIFWDTKMRIIEFSFRNSEEVTVEDEELVKKQIFKRYNSGITPLKSVEIDKAKYFDDDVNAYFKKIISADKILLNELTDIFHYEAPNIEILLKKMRQLLVLHLIPISYYTTRKDEVITKFYENLSNNTVEPEDIENLFNNFQRKINILKNLKKVFKDQNVATNREIFECILWALSILQEEEINLDEVENAEFRKSLVKYISKFPTIYFSKTSSFAKDILERYQSTANFFSEKFGIDFTLYLRNHDDFRIKNKELKKGETDSDALSKFESLRLNKPEPSSNTIDDICRQMTRQRFLIRPPYQRNEVINKIKSSAIIESILLGIKLPPIFIYKREDEGLSEVLDGQQRLLSILGFIGKEYLDEKKKMAKSDKNQFALNIKKGILKNLDGKKFDKLPSNLQDKILDYDLWLVEISKKNNPNFDPIDLFIRLNYKPYPIKENTFEMWNSYVDRVIIEEIKAMYLKYKDWFYLRKSNERMDNEGLITSLIYLDFKFNSFGNKQDKISDFLDVYKVGSKINIRIKSKDDISKILDEPSNKLKFLESRKRIEDSFILKIRTLLNSKTESTLTKRFDEYFNKGNSRRTNQNFYALWYFLNSISIQTIENNRVSVKNDITELFNRISNLNNKTEFDSAISKFRKAYK